MAAKKKPKKSTYTIEVIEISSKGYTAYYFKKGKDGQLRGYLKGVEIDPFEVVDALSTSENYSIKGSAIVDRTRCTESYNDGELDLGLKKDEQQYPDAVDFLKGGDPELGPPKAQFGKRAFVRYWFGRGAKVGVLTPKLKIEWAEGNTL